jgi:coenzyme F420-reducing hydrogenase alpha subunit
MTTRRRIRVDYLTRVEGEGALELELDQGRAVAARLSIFEPPRFFEALLRGRDHAELPDLVARICGICPVAYQVSAVQAVERAFGVHVDGALRELRRLLYCGEWIESHALHVAMLHAPDFLGFPDAIAMAASHRDMVQAALALKAAGNQILRTLGGREIHPVSLRPGGFHRLPRATELASLRPLLQQARGHADSLLDWVAGFDFPSFERDYVFVSLRHPLEYPITEGRVVSSRGLDIDIAQYEQEFEERHVAHSTALHGMLRAGGPYLVGPLARYALNFDRLPDALQQRALRAGLGRVCRNPFRSIVVRALETLYACEEALRILDAWQPPPLAALPLQPRAGVGFGASEAPRGLCWHRYGFAADGSVTEARIVPPTSQNQATIEADLLQLADSMALAEDEPLRERCEQAIRNHDPCISCSTHFLRLSVRRHR